jgi:hypothetical protein
VLCPASMWSCLCLAGTTESQLLPELVRKFHATPLTHEPDRPISNGLEPKFVEMRTRRCHLWELLRAMKMSLSLSFLFFL